jgi:hypothetical protein
MQSRSEPVHVVRPLRGGQVTIPEEFQRALGIEGESLIQLTLLHGELRIRPVDAPATAPGSSWLREAYEAFAPIREELVEKYSGDEIDAAIDQAIKAVRQANASRGL